MSMAGERDLLTWLQAWYGSRCDGAWEHACGVRIDTLDNPGWRVEVDVGDEVAELCHQEVRSALDWVDCRVERGKFLGSGGPGNLAEILGVLRGWLEPP